MKETIPANPAHPRYRQLDSLRGLGALSVFFAHFISLKISLPWLHLLQQSPLGILFNGTAALMLFFILSGFVLSLPFVDDKKSLKFSEFYVKRVFRIYPAYIFAILFAALLKEFVFDRNGLTPWHDWINNFWAWEWNPESPREILKTLLLIGPDFKVNYIDPPIWSLVIEMKMSVILPFFILIVSRGGKTLNIGFLFVIAWLTYQHNAWAISVFYLGILMAKYKEVILNNIQAWNGTVVTIVIVISILLYNNNYELMSLIKQINLPSKYIFSDYISTIGSCVLLMTILARKNLSQFFEKRIFTFFGDISYSFYLIHVPLLLTLGSLFSNRFDLSPIYIFFSAFTLAVVGAYLMSIYIEKPFQHFASRLIKKYSRLPD